MSDFPEPDDGSVVVVEYRDGINLFVAIRRNDANSAACGYPDKRWGSADDNPEVDPGSWDDWTAGALAVYDLGSKLARLPIGAKPTP